MLPRYESCLAYASFVQISNDIEFRVNISKKTVGHSTFLNSSLHSLTVETNLLAPPGGYDLLVLPRL